MELRHMTEREAARSFHRGTRQRRSCRGVFGWLCSAVLVVAWCTCMANGQQYHLQLTASPDDMLNTALELVLTMKLTFEVASNDLLTISMPRFTTGSADGTVGSPIAWGSVHLTPSTLFSGQWTDSSFVSMDDAYPSSKLQLQVRAGERIKANTQTVVTVLKSNNIKAFCSVQPDWSRINMTVNSTGAGNNLTSTFVTTPAIGSGCSELSDCNEHGTCNYCSETCVCNDGYGSNNDVFVYAPPDCSHRICPSGPAIADIPTGYSDAHALAECSNKGKCDRVNGRCSCFPGFAGDACQRTACPNDCSGHGRCVSMAEMATMDEATPLTRTNTEYGTAATRGASTWDYESMYACVCDSAWTVGLDSAETQTTEFFGADCSLQHCPSGDDPMTPTSETDCENVTAAGGRGIGKAGNLCHVDCANRGVCDYETGKCACFEGYIGENCATKSSVSASALRQLREYEYTTER